MNRVILKTGLVAVVIFLTACSGDSNPGYEFMPNMYRSPSLETYGENTINGMNALTPVEGTVARGHLLTFNYDGTLEGYLAAGKEAVNPLEKSEKNLTDGKALYGMFCKHCHGKTGAGDGTITHAIYSAVPHYNDDKLKRRCDLPMCDLKAGHIFHAITYGLNAMGPHATQITEDERWKIVLYVQEELQHSGRNLNKTKKASTSKEEKLAAEQKERLAAEQKVKLATEQRVKLIAKYEEEIASLRAREDEQYLFYKAYKSRYATIPEANPYIVSHQEAHDARLDAENKLKKLNRQE